MKATRGRWRRLALSVSFVTTTAVLIGCFTAGSVLASKPSRNCPAASSGYELVGKQVWWDRTAAGFVAEEIPVYQDPSIAHVFNDAWVDDGKTFTAKFNDFAEAVGFGDGYGLWHYVWLDQWDAFDLNHNALVCMKTRPHTPGNPYYFFGGVDDQSSSPHGDNTPA